jgi:hypothetical protein
MAIAKVEQLPMFYLEIKLAPWKPRRGDFMLATRSRLQRARVALGNGDATLWVITLVQNSF